MSSRKITILKVQESTRSIASLSQISEEELPRYRNGLPKGFREEVDCDKDTILFLHPDFPPLNFEKIRELLILPTNEMIPIVAIDAQNQILMQAFGNEESQRLTLQTGYAHYFSRSRNRLWKKGDTSGHTQKILQILSPLNRSFLVYQVEQKIAACHEGYYSCFFRERMPGGEWNLLPVSRNFLPEKN
ncbi:phosphoribosyl-AMP cyclohydrolase [Leptospira borgpetersenii]|uniref:phosphoribosyl-AMP cyclohydrolase n=1 Tax=Leptospira borgpetersenii TaxID=174 RepID=UPI0018803B16|nr:phosphoribosyl-AMP cyclohydrolase [Leptospira borgpetersenii]MBE8362771.1 phosphoribosyl-AMP cyclohydrolase [Leptospira borgpetersenii serovar Balcanica]MBE8366581.1 phosphoribosyl-AMP cyclohydrolase [Leptospira borgpetersenii serovar Balcanica]MBE8421825.1 phosphoribosyl-AMP cyclohydrolase [Leptospira borgpetersenii serovar Balcanica]MBF3348896.1 phosphoribosyl-AMP cyclohydrolase [Leptospira borgpetersenii serovar Balcanica]